MEPIATIGLCVKNNEATVREAVNSIINQDFPDDHLEVIVVDGCSQDQTLRIIKEVLSKRAINVRIFSENKGLGFARQVVVNNATGKYVLWLDSDIFLSKNYVKQQTHFMENNPEAAATVGSFGLVPHENWVAMLESIGYIVESLKNDGKSTSKLIGTKGSIFLVKAIRMAGGFDLNIKGAQEDLDLTYRLYSMGWKFFTTNARLYERQRITWGAIWKRHFWYGYGLHYIQHKHKGRNMFFDKSNDRIIISSQAYKLTHRKLVFLLPLNFIFRKMALLFGFLKSHLDGYGHKILT